VPLELPEYIALAVLGYACVLGARWRSLRCEIAVARSTVPIDSTTGLLLSSALDGRIGMELRRARRLGGTVTCAFITAEQEVSLTSLGRDIAASVRYPTTGFRLDDRTLALLTYAESEVAPKMPSIPASAQLHAVIVPIGMVDAEISQWVDDVRGAA